MVLAIAEGLTMHNHLVFPINEGLAVIPWTKPWEIIMVAESLRGDPAGF